MNDDRYARLALDLLSRRSRSTAHDLLGDRAATLAEMRRALRRRTRWWVTGGVVLSAAASFALVLGVVLLADRLPGAPPGTARNANTPTAVPTTGPLAGFRTVRLSPGDRLTATDSPLRVSPSGGTRLALGPTGQMDVIEVGTVQRYGLRAGRLRVDVARLSPGQRFVIVTGDSEVEVKGTSFELTAEPRLGSAQGPATDLRVFEGVVAVSHAGRQWMVPAGQTWTSRRAPPPPPPARAPARRAPAAPPAPSPSTLAQQNDLFTDALAHHQSGDLRAALRRVEELLRRFPDGSLADSARAERAKLLTEMNERDR